jgi:hypothetical protein
VLTLVACACFARLVGNPTDLIVDGERPYVDWANPGEPRGVGNDATFSYLPHHLSIAQVIRVYGHVPQWDDRGFGGRPLVANPQAGLFYPPVWLAWFWRAPSALGWITVGHLVWGGIGTYILVRSLNAGRLSATVAAAVYQASPYLMAHTIEGHYPHVWGACWYPWAFWAFQSRRPNQHVPKALLPVILALASLTGHPQEWFLLVLALSIWAAYNAFARARSSGLKSGVNAFAAWGCVLALSLGLAAIALVPQLAVRPYLASGFDLPVTTGLPRRYHVWILNVWQLLSPTALGGPSDYFGNDNYWETLLSIGVVPLFLGFIAAVRHPDRTTIRGWLALAGICVWLACGRKLGLFSVVYLAVPGMSWFRVPARALFLANLAAAVLAGLGVEALARSALDARQWRRLAARFLAIMTIVIGALFATTYVERIDASARAAIASARVLESAGFWLVIVGIVIAMALGCFGRGASASRRPIALIGLLAIVELAWYAFLLVPTASATRFLGPDPIGDAISRLDSPGKVGRTRIKTRDSAYSDLKSVASGLEKTNINDMFQLGEPASLYKLLYPIAAFQRRPFEGVMQEAVEDYKQRLRQADFDRMSVRYLVSDRVEKDPGWPVVAEGSSAQKPRWIIQRNPTALPRAYVAPRAIVTDERERFVIPRFLHVDPRQAVLMPYDPLAGVSEDSRQTFVAAEWTSLDPDHPALAVTTSGAGLLVVADTFMPGWTARVDGEVTEVAKGNVSQRVIPLRTAGRHRVSLDYRAPGLAPGCGITLFSIAVWITLCARQLIHSRNSSQGGYHRHAIQRRPRQAVAP